jgi:hypothetical protein
MWVIVTRDGKIAGSKGNDDNRGWLLCYAISDCPLNHPPQRGEGLTVGLTVGLGIGLTDTPAFGTIGVGLVIGVGEMPGELFRIGLVLGSGLVLGTVCPPMLPPGCVVPAGLVVVPP